VATFLATLHVCVCSPINKTDTDFHDNVYMYRPNTELSVSARAVQVCERKSIVTIYSVTTCIRWYASPLTVWFNQTRAEVTIWSQKKTKRLPSEHFHARSHDIKSTQNNEQKFWKMTTTGLLYSLYGRVTMTTGGIVKTAQ